MEAQMRIDGEAVRSLREQKSWSQEHLASASGLSVRTIQRVEVENVGSAETRLALAAALDVPVTALFLEADRSPAITSSKRRLRVWGWIGLGAVFASILAVVLLSALGTLSVPESEYATFLSAISAGEIEQVTFDGDVIRGQRYGGEEFIVYNPQIDNRALVQMLRDHNVRFGANPARGTSLPVQLLVNLLPALFLIAVLIYLGRRIRGTGAGA